MTPLDRLIEIDVDALGGVDGPSRVDDVIDRLLPLWRDALQSGGTTGLVLNLGWLMDPIALFSGSLTQALPISSTRLTKYAELDYRWLADLVSGLRVSARTRGVPHLRVGMLVLGIGEFVNEIVRPPTSGTEDTRAAALYQERGAWFARHPELFPFSPEVTLHGPGVDWRVPLDADPLPYASRPTGISAGESFGEFFAEQWARFATAVGFDLLLLRDETTTPVHAGRVAFDGSSEPALPEQIDEWTSALVSVTSAVKKHLPTAMLVIYSSGLSPTVESRYGRLEIARVVAEGGIDAWIDQTWGGAWQDWWDAGWQGWSFQLSNLLARGALIAEGNEQRSVPCRHYPLFQLLDGWEPYDTLHDYPEKLKWGIWAFSHASTRSGGVDSPPAGAYLAVANDRRGVLVAETDVAWVAATLSESSASAARLERILGPVLVVPDRQDAERGSSTSESVEDAAGFLMKWGAPVLTAVTSALACDEYPEGTVIPAASASRPFAKRTSGPRLFVGAPEDLDAETRKRLGLIVGDDVSPSGYRQGIMVGPLNGLKARAWPYLGRRRTTTTTPGTTVLYDGEDGPTATQTAREIWWLPPGVANGADRRMTHYQVGTVDPHVVVAWAFARSGEQADLLRVEPPAPHQTVSLHGWISGGVLHLLLGNVESGWIGDSRYPRTARVVIPRTLLAGLERPALVLSGGGEVPVQDGVATIEVPPESYELARLHLATAIRSATAI